MSIETTMRDAICDQSLIKDVLLMASSNSYCTYSSARIEIQNWNQLLAEDVSFLLEIFAIYSG